MVAGSDVVVVAKVAAVEPGRVLSDTSDYTQQASDVTLQIEKLLSGKAPSQVLMEETGLEMGRPSLVGDYGVYFLHEKLDDPGVYRLDNSQARYLQSSDGSLTGIDEEDPLVQALEKRTQQLESDVQDAVSHLSG